MQMALCDRGLLAALTRVVSGCGFQTIKKILLLRLAFLAKLLEYPSRGFLENRMGNEEGGKSFHYFNLLKLLVSKS